MTSYIIHDTKLKHADGHHNLEVEIDGEQSVIRFGSSFTLRLDEESIDQLRNILYDTSRELCVNRSNRLHNERQAEVDAAQLLRSDQQAVDLWDLPEEDDVTGYPV